VEFDMAPKKSYDPIPIEIKQFSIEEIEKGLKKLNRRIEEVKKLDPNQIRFDDTQVDNVESNIRTTILEIFGKNSPEFNDHGYHSIWHGGHIMGEPEHILQSKFAEGIPQTIKMLTGLFERLEEKRDDLTDVNPQSTVGHAQTFGSRRVFIVHGKDEKAKESVARFISKLKLEPIILHEQPNLGKTIIEKFETHTDVDFAVILLTPDDVGYECGKSEEKKNRARQNVILELGYFIGKIQRARVCALHKGDLELPSDYHGILYIPLDESKGWQISLAKEIKAAGIEIDLNLAI
jgi:predicted nucleotide-binding protein